MRKTIPAIIAVALAAALGAEEAASPRDVLVKGGRYPMGIDRKRAAQSNGTRWATVKSFRIAAKETTVGEFSAFVAATGYRTTGERDGKGAFIYNGDDAFIRFADKGWRSPGFEQGPDDPVTCVSWYDAIEYCNWLSARDGLVPAYAVKGASVSWNRSANGWRLPTEAEWELAARGGAGGTLGIGDYEDLGPYAWDWRDSGDRTRPAGSKLPNAIGLYDMLGNAQEWCWDYWARLKAGEYRDPAGPKRGAFRVNRGGHWKTGLWNEGSLNEALREFTDPAVGYSTNGFRVARNAE